MESPSSGTPTIEVNGWQTARVRTLNDSKIELKKKNVEERRKNENKNITYVFFFWAHTMLFLYLPYPSKLYILLTIFQLPNLKGNEKKKDETNK